MSIERARSLRKRLSPPEARLWNALRLDPLRDFHFRRQLPIGPYYADFASHRLKLIIEVDGASHSDGAALAHDAERTAFLNARGYQVLRVTTTDVFSRLDGIIEASLAIASPTHRPSAGPPSPQGGGSDD